MGKRAEKLKKELRIAELIIRVKNSIQANQESLMKGGQNGRKN